MRDDHINEIVKYASELIELSESFLSDHNSYDNEDSMAFMSFIFLNRQLDHMQSIVKLSPIRDTVIISRSMIEGAFHLLWSSQSPDVRALKWREYAVVVDWKLLKFKQENGETVSSEEETGVLERFRRHGDQFLRSSGQNLVDDNQRDNLTPEHYHKDFLCGTTLPSIVKELKSDYPYIEDQYYGTYIHYSSWAHWGVSGIGQAISTNGNTVLYSEKCNAYTLSALTCGVQCLLTTLRIAHNHFVGNDWQQINDFEQRLANYLVNME